MPFHLIRPSSGTAALAIALLPLSLMLTACDPGESALEQAAGQTDTGQPGIEIDSESGQGTAPLITAAPPTDLAAFGADNHSISQNEYRINPGFLNERVVHLGDGIDMENPEAPKRRSGLNPLQIPAPLKTGPGVSDYTLDQTFEYKEASSASDEAGILSAYFQGSYKFASADAAYRKAIEERSNSESVYVLLQEVGYTEDISGLLNGQRLLWDPNVKPQYEGVYKRPQRFRRQFLLDFGSHYVSAIEYGYRLAIRGRIKEVDTKKTQSIKAAFKATFAGGGAEGGVDGETRKTLSSSSLELTLVATSGGFVYDGEVRTPVLTGLDDILGTLKQLRSGELKIRGAPLQLTAQTYWNRLPPEFELSRALLDDHGEPPRPPQTYGVPAGTVLAWRPLEASFFTDTRGEKHLMPPLGWALCDGSGGTPDLRNRFIYGTTDADQIGTKAGVETHVHSGSVSANTSGKSFKPGANFKGEIDAAAVGHSHGVTLDPASSLPPLVRLAFIIKL